ncbi:dihydrolipoyl dehydrogenase family protein [Craterilacuibacter sp.]|uniref:dihydrolipoyl dehydrogenase family protein n=1 Tax=Craterilacuibacter sp. TaxID=2870909 RepID=UPI003F2BBAA7
MASVPPLEFVVLGGGLAGRRLARDLAQRGHQGALVEYNAFGGASINVSCLPDAVMVRAARIAHQMRQGVACGVGDGARKVDLARLFACVGETVAAARAHDLALWPAERVELVLGHGHLVAADVVEVALHDGTLRRLRSRRIFVSTGSASLMPAVAGLADACPMTQRELLCMTRLPPHLAILGASFGGLAYAQIFARLGCDVTLIDAAPRVARFEDTVFSDAIGQLLRRDGVRLLTSTVVERVRGISGAGVTLEARQGRQSLELDASDLLLAGARAPLTANLGLEALGVQLAADGRIVVDDSLQSSVSGIYALGEVAAHPMPGHAVSDDARVALSLFHPPLQPMRGRVLPRLAFIDPEYARIGLSEAEAAQAGLKVRVVSLAMDAVTRAWAEGESSGLMQAVIAADSDTLLGFAMLGVGAGEVMSVVQMAMQAGLPYTALADTPLAHPTASEALNTLFANVSAA